MRRHTPRTALTATAAALALLLTGCAGGDGPAEADGTVHLRFQSLAWQKESVAANKQLVSEWNATHPDIQVDYVQGSWDNVHDQLLTSFEGGEAPDVIHDASDDLADFAYGGYLADLRTLLPGRLTEDIPERSWRTTTFDGGVYGVPFLQEPRVLIADTKALRAAGVRIPTPRRPWSWPEFRRVTEELSGEGRYGVAWPLKEPVSVTLNLGLSAGGQLFHRGADGKTTVRFEEGDQVMPGTVRDQVNADRSATRSALGMSGSDTLPGLFGGKYAMVPLGFSYRQQVAEQAPEGFEWSVLPAPAGSDGLAQGVSPQTLSVARDSPHKEEAVRFVDYLLRPANMVRLAKGDWMLPTGTEALADPALHTAEDGWATGAALAGSLRPAPAQFVRGYPEWKDKVATPALQEYYSGAIGTEELGRRLVEDGNRVLARYQR
ncbi:MULTISPECIES: extracellular solute-binding protein [unclassified Streptomyces]|uniref:ABC transporter substrate-binding protein n=1 Tax=unclassified Streptomyces TaxID=2593676 RepID=UPI0001C1BB37|nr:MULTISPECIES: extracellular solute-binding protein [unclassified Streptomyces]AEN13139.1 extracellular solute-binding protein family 1 [Streptomyces sp. SirexAA-E]MYR65521.1 extracellular solute-binding protein [Streptomyces sp. SID4939]MYS01841.1 extracellular solute-binding protein [Streptomyces sp. SID4940]MYT67409.1 extracellular solute-binding protein [Streptomyces sp. SID8357]MYT87905.1 extracellular solute-binding protein [Streptomyces sp. SID8360]